MRSDSGVSWNYPRKGRIGWRVNITYGAADRCQLSEQFKTDPTSGEIAGVQLVCDALLGTVEGRGPSINAFEIRGLAPRAAWRAPWDGGGRKEAPVVERIGE